jgi:hypothetical protein
MNAKPRLIVLLCSVLTTVGACVGPGTKFKVRESKPQGLVIGVKPFKLAKKISGGVHMTPVVDDPSCPLDLNPRGVLAYEKIALAAFLAERLKSMPGISEVLIVTEDTPAVDATVDAEIECSNAEGFAINTTVRRMDGKVLNNSFFYRQSTLRGMDLGPLDAFVYFIEYPLVGWPMRLVLEPMINPIFHQSDPWNPRVMAWPYGPNNSIFGQNYAHSIKDPSEIVASDAKLIDEIAKDVVRSFKNYRFESKGLRAAVYADNKVKEPNEQMIRMGEEAARVEREQVWVPISQALTTRIEATKNAYYAWKKEALVFSDKKVVAHAQKSAAETMEMLGAMTSMSAGMLAGASAAQGNTQFLAPSINLATQGAELMAQGAADAAVAANRIRELDAALTKCAESLNYGVGHQITVRIYNKVYQLKGSREEMLRELHRVVKEEMNKASQS